MCTNPFHLFIVGIDPVTLKKEVKITTGECDYVYFDGRAWTGASFDFHNDSCTFTTCYDGRPVIDNYYEVPCRKCTECLQRRSNDYTTRLLLESTLYCADEVHFLTLTYDNEHLPIREYFDEDGVLRSEPFLCVSDIQKFLKRLRKHYKDCDIRYFCTLEYGTKTHRPHAHMILFGVPLNLVYWSLSGKGKKKNPIYYCPEINSPVANADNSKALWKNGGVLIGKPSNESFKYACKYSAKYGDCIHLCSRRPAIGLRWLEKNFDSVLKNHRCIDVEYGINCPIPRYFNDKIAEKLMADFDIAGTVLLDDHIETVVENAIVKEKLRSEKSTLSRKEYLRNKEEIYKANVNGYRNAHCTF